MSDCMFDYLVDSCFASIKDFREGEPFKSLTGTEFRAYSRLDKIDFTSDEPKIIFVSPGTYRARRWWEFWR